MGVKISYEVPMPSTIFRDSIFIDESHGNDPTVNLQNIECVDSLANIVMESLCVYYKRAILDLICLRFVSHQCTYFSVRTTISKYSVIHRFFYKGPVKILLGTRAGFL